MEQGTTRTAPREPSILRASRDTKEAEGRARSARLALTHPRTHIIAPHVLQERIPLPVLPRACNAQQGHIQRATPHLARSVGRDLSKIKLPLPIVYHAVQVRMLPIMDQHRAQFVALDRMPHRARHRALLAQQETSKIKRAPRLVCPVPQDPLPARQGSPHALSAQEVLMAAQVQQLAIIVGWDITLLPALALVLLVLQVPLEILHNWPRATPAMLGTHPAVEVAHALRAARDTIRALLVLFALRVLLARMEHSKVQPGALFAPRAHRPLAAPLHALNAGLGITKLPKVAHVNIVPQGPTQIRKGQRVAPRAAWANTQETRETRSVANAITERTPIPPALLLVNIALQVLLEIRLD